MTQAYPLAWPSGWPERMADGLICVSRKAGYEEQSAARRHVAQNLVTLRGKDLACWCALDRPCHADALLEIANAPMKCEAVDG